MIKSEVSTLLAAIYACERRTDAVSQVEVEVWFSIIGDLDFRDVQEAVTRHFSDSESFLTPQRIRTLVRELHSARRSNVIDPLKVPLADPDDVLAFIRALRNGQYESDPIPGEPPREGLPLGEVGRTVPKVTRAEVEDDAPRPRRWWLPRRHREDGKDQSAE